MVGVAIAPEGEAVPAVEPSRRRLAALGGASYRHHLAISFPQIRSCRCSRVARSGNCENRIVGSVDAIYDCPPDDLMMFHHLNCSAGAVVANYGGRAALVACGRSAPESGARQKTIAVHVSQNEFLRSWY